MLFETIQALDFTSAEIAQPRDEFFNQHFGGGCTRRHPNPKTPPNALGIEFAGAANQQGFDAKIFGDFA
jgi:hypothetical protein